MPPPPRQVGLTPCPTPKRYAYNATPGLNFHLDRKNICGDGFSGRVGCSEQASMKKLLYIENVIAENSCGNIF